MSHNPYDAYLEGRILSADPLELVQFLYQGASDAVRQARRHLSEGNIAGRSRSISRAFEILAELLGSLDRARGGELANRLAHLYDYMQRRLIEANVQQADGPLAEVLSLLATLGEAWQGVHAQTAPPAGESHAWAGGPVAEAEPVPHAWSF